MICGGVRTPRYPRAVEKQFTQLIPVHRWKSKIDLVKRHIHHKRPARAVCSASLLLKVLAKITPVGILKRDLFHSPVFSLSLPEASAFDHRDRTEGAFLRAESAADTLIPVQNKRPFYRIPDNGSFLAARHAQGIITLLASVWNYEMTDSDPVTYVTLITVPALALSLTGLAIEATAQVDYPYRFSYTLRIHPCFSFLSTYHLLLTANHTSFTAMPSANTISVNPLYS